MTMFNAEAILNERLWLKRFLAEKHDHVILDGKTDRIDLDLLSTVCGTRGSGSTIFLFDEMGILLGQVGRRKEVCSRGVIDRWLGKQARIAEVSHRETVLDACSVWFGTTTPPHFIVEVRYNSLGINFTLSRPKNNFSIKGWAQKLRDDAKKLIETTELAIDAE